MKFNKIFHKTVLVVLVIYLLLPLAATLIFSIAGKWDHTLLPESITFKWYGELFSDERFYQALLRSLFLILVTVAISNIIMLPTIFIVAVYFRRFERILQAVAMLPYGIPPIVGAVGLIKVYSSGPLQISGTPWLLVGAYFVITMPYMYQGIRNSLQTINAQELVSAAELLGATKFQAFQKIVVPNILSGIFVSTLLSIALLFGEFVLANLLVGGRFETIQIYLYQKLNKSGHTASAIVITYYVIILLLTWIILKLKKRPMQFQSVFGKRKQLILVGEKTEGFLKGEHK